VLSGDYPEATFSTANASLEFAEQRPFPGSAGQSLWWSWTAPRSGFVTVEVVGASAGNAGLSVYTGSAFDLLECIITGVGRCAFQAVPGQIYSISVDGLSGTVQGTLVVAQADVEIGEPVKAADFTAPVAVVVNLSRTGFNRTLQRIDLFANDQLVGSINSEPFTLTVPISDPGPYALRVRAYDVLGVATDSISVPIVVRPQNDDFENAILISGYTVTVAASNRSATMQLFRQYPWDRPTGEPTYADNQGGHSIWYKWIAPEDGYCVLSGAGESFGLLLGAYVGSTVSTLSLVAVNALNGGGPPGFFAFAGTTYYITVDGGFGEEGNLAWDLQLRTKNDDYTHRSLMEGSSYEVITSFLGADLEGEGTSPLLTSGDLLHIAPWWSDYVLRRSPDTIRRTSWGSTWPTGFCPVN